jgi:hypothetical protein
MVALIEGAVYGKRSRGRGETLTTTGRRKRREIEDMWVS